MSYTKKSFTAKIKTDLLDAADNCTKSGEAQSIADCVNRGLEMFLKLKKFYPLKKEIKLTSKQLGELRRLGIVDEIGIRNYWIKQEADRRSRQSKSKNAAIEEIAAELNMTPEIVHDIYYRKSKKEKPVFDRLKEIE